MKRGMNKRGETPESSLTGLIISVALVAVVVLAILYFSGMLTGGAKILPKDLELLASSCGFSVSQNLETSYCNEFKPVKIGFTTQYVNCKYAAENLGAVIPNRENIDAKCVPSEISKSAVNLCNELKDGAKVNGIICCKLDANKKCVTMGADSWGVSKDHLGA